MKKISVFVIWIMILTTITACSANKSAENKNIGDNSNSGIESQASKPMKGTNGGLDSGDVDTSSIKTQYTDISYSNVSKTQTLNIYLPNEGSGPFPIILAIHGGAFKMGSATGGDVAAMLEGVNHGYAVVSVNYRLSDEAIFPAAVNDCKAAIRFIRANASKYNLNPEKIGVWGDSAGGNLATMIGTSGDLSILEDDNIDNINYSSTVQAVVDWFGPLDFLKIDEQFTELGITPKFGKTSSETSPESQYIGQLITLDTNLTQKANPETYLTEMNTADAPSFLIQHGTADSNVPYLQSVNFAKQLQQVIGDGKVSIELIEGAGHGTQEFTSNENMDTVFKFLDSILK